MRLEYRRQFDRFGLDGLARADQAFESGPELILDEHWHFSKAEVQFFLVAKPRTQCLQEGGETRMRTPMKL